MQKDKNGYCIKDGLSVKFDLKDAQESITPVSIPYSGTISGEPFKNASSKMVIIVEDNESDFFTLPVSKVEVIMNRSCNECHEAFNAGELKTVVDEGIGKQLIAVKECPYCDSQDLTEI
ncbi:MAG TPA: hypothetical protein VJY62_15050 [Bacteroidia bacterium]|nr:hypothetical protein [Bacteroidia bacterium]